MARRRFIACTMAALASAQAGHAAADELVLITAWPENPFYQAVMQGCADAGAHLEGGWTCTLRASGPGDVTQQISAIESGIASGVAGIAVEAINDGAAPALSRASDAGLRTLTFLSDVRDDARIAFVGTDEDAFRAALARMAADHVRNASANSPRPFAIVMRVPESPREAARAEAVRTALAAAGATEIDGGPFLCSGNNGADGLAQLARRSDIGLIIAVGDCSGMINPADALGNMAGQTPADAPAVIAACSDPSQLDNVGTGGLVGMVCEQPAEVGRALMEAFHTLVAGGNLENTRILVPPLSRP